MEKMPACAAFLIAAINSEYLSILTQKKNILSVLMVLAVQLPIIPILRVVEAKRIDRKISNWHLFVFKNNFLC
jgi:hypothetical protein